MTNGALIFAQNNASIDYTKLAIFSAKQVRKHLGIPVSLVTDNAKWLHTAYPDSADIFDKVIEINDKFDPKVQTKKFYDGSLSYKKQEWKNHSRVQAYDLTPYDKTLVLDSDYIINSNVLKAAFDSDHEFQIYQQSMDLAAWRDTSSFHRINQRSILFYWATAFVFEKTPITKSFFSLITHIKENWEYYRVLYSIDSTVYRNDFAFSIAIYIMNGNVDNNQFSMPLPGTMTYVTDRDLLVTMQDNKMQFLVEKEMHRGEYTAVKTTGMDVHVMNKHSLTRFIDGGTGV